MDHSKDHLRIINQLFEVDKKIRSIHGAEGVLRNLERIKNYFEEMGYHIYNPLGEPYSETRTDCEASIAGTSTENLYIQEVIKPIVHQVQQGESRIIQKGIVIAASR
jgi:hypothetical protein